MKYSTLGSYLPNSLVLAPDAAPGLSVTGDAALDAAVMSRLGMELTPATDGGSSSATATEDRGGTKEPAAAEAAKAAKGDANEDETQTAEEIATAETAATERQAKLDALVAEGKSAEEAEAEVAAEEEAAAAAVQTPELTEEVKTWHEAQLAAKDEEVTAAKQAAEEATAKISELEAQLQSAGTQPLAIAPIDPLFLIDDPAQLDVEAGKLRNFEAWALKNWDGVEAVEASADGKTKASPGFTPEQVRERYAQVKEIRESILPAARENIKARQAHAAQGRKAYPELFDPKRPEFKVAENLLKLAPGLKAVVPNIHIVIGDALRGEKIRLAEEKARAKGKVIAGKTATPPKVVKPGAGGTSNIQRSTANAQKKTEVLDTTKFTKAMEAGGTGRAALVAALS